VAETETITLNLDGTFPAEATKGAAAGEKLTAALDGLTNGLESNSKAIKEHGEHVQKVKEPAEIARHALDGLSAGLKGLAGALVAGDVKGMVEGATEALSGMASMLDLVVPGLGQAAAAAVKAAGAFAGLIASGVETALEVTAMNAQLEATFDALGKGPGAGAATVAMLDELSAKLPQSREKLSEWARAIAASGVTDVAAIKNEVLATASAQGLLGEKGVAAFEKIERKVHEAIEGQHALKLSAREVMGLGPAALTAAAEKMGMTYPKLAAAVKGGLDPKKAEAFGNALEGALIEKGGKGLDALWMTAGAAKLKESFVKLFDGIDVTPITGAMRDLLALFDQTQPSGQAMKTTITDAFNGIVKAIGGAIEAGIDMALDFEIWGLSMELALIPVWSVLKKIGHAIDAVTGGALDKLSHVAGLDAMSQGPPVAPQPKTAEALVAHAELAMANYAAGRLIGGGLVGGLVSSLLERAEEAFGAGKGLGAAAAAGTAAGAQVKSPSRLTMQVGAYMAEGLGIGMTDSTVPARAGRQLSSHALGGLVGSAITSPAASGNGGGGGVTLHVDSITITAPQGVTDAAQLSATGLAVALERFQLASGR